MDDVDAAHAQIARNMMSSGDWVTARLNGIVYLEKAPLAYWLITTSFHLFGVRDWAARIPAALFAVGLCWLTARFGGWAFGKRAGGLAGLCLATCVGLFLFTRILIPDVMLTATVTLGLWSFLRTLEEDEPHPRRWALLLSASLGLGLLLKGLIAVVVPAGAGLVYLLLTRQLVSGRTWRRLRPLHVLLGAFLIASPWYVLATLGNPPYLDFSFHSGPGEYRGFFWFYFINEHLLRYLNLRYPRDYDTVPRLAFWLLHLVWLFPWSVYFPAALRLSYSPANREGRARLLAVCWAGFVLGFFTFSTTQEYYSMPCYPALALLLGSAIAAGGCWVRIGTQMISMLSFAALAGAAVILFQVRGIPTPGDISAALTQNPEAYALSLGHLADLTLRSFAYLRLPLALAGVAFLVGALGARVLTGHRAFIAVAAMMVLFAHAARLALVVFDPYLSSRPLAEALRQAPEGRLIAAGEYYAFSSVFFYSNRPTWLLNGRMNNLEYGSYAPGAPSVFIDERELKRHWFAGDRYYLLADKSAVNHLNDIVGKKDFYPVAESGGKLLFTNQALVPPVAQPLARGKTQ
ncbi:MAG: glycosyltransferase family 39 protein [Acidobacteria bacterium]|nr:glycosyltransferase family 39 protein [Acidobacteriota bacterium]